MTKFADFVHLAQNIKTKFLMIKNTVEYYYLSMMLEID